MSHEGEVRRPGGFTGFLMAASAVLAILVVLLTWQNLRLKAELERAGGVRPEPLKEGDAFGSLVLVDESGEPTQYVFGEDGRRTLLLVFTQECPYCQETLPFWNGLLAEATPPDLRVVGLQLDRDSHPGPWPALAFEVYGVDYDGSESLHKITSIPATLLLDGDGVVQHAWYGMFSDETEQELRRSLAEG